MIYYLTGDATQPVSHGPKIIAHVANCMGGWGAGFVLAISKRWQGPEKHYRALKVRNLSDTHFIKVEPDLWVANMIAQGGYGRNNLNLHRTSEPDDEIPLKYDSLAACLKTVGQKALELGASVHMPRIGCALGGGSWTKVEPLIRDNIPLPIPVMVYDFPGSRFNP